ncbi:LysR family transcriptional regulator [Variovorax sp. KK3]|uniref:LysR family transcriptional regulator n=1 Tax=Variovorax sp. KK3 TaxID=1855728 RepID=UPI00097C9C2C|nr:LysR family transcriptional regulator [Variovorax sp. KK3]
MDLRQIRQFAVLAEELNFRKAAERLHISQPPLSATIRRLEESLGVQLFDRDRHNVKLTLAGQVFHNEARRILGQVHEAVALTRNTALGISGVLRVSCVPSAFLDLLPAALQRFHEAYPEVRVIVTRELSSKQLDDVSREKVDVAILIPNDTLDAGQLKTDPLRHERFILAVPSAHRLAAEKSVRVADIVSDPLLAFFSLSDSPGFSGPLLRAFKESALNPNLMYDQTQWVTNLVMVAGGFGLAIVPRPMRTFQLSGISYIDLVHDDGSPITYPVAAVRKKNSGNAIAENFVAIVAEIGKP